jgi:hypothetical protein
MGLLDLFRSKPSGGAVTRHGHPPEQGTVVSFRRSSRELGHRAQVAEIDGDLFTLRGERLPAVYEGERMIISWPERDQIHVLRADVVHAGEAIQMRATPIREAFPQLRTSERTPFEHRLTCEVISARMVRDGFEAQTVELSDGGISFTTSAPLAPGDRIMMPLPQSESPVEAEIVRVLGSSSSWRPRVSARWV